MILVWPSQMKNALLLNFYNKRWGSSGDVLAMRLTTSWHLCSLSFSLWNCNSCLPRVVLMDFCSHSWCEYRRLLVKVKLLSLDLALSEDLSASLWSIVHWIQIVCSWSLRITEGSHCDANPRCNSVSEIGLKESFARLSLHSH